MPKADPKSEHKTPSRKAKPAASESDAKTKPAYREIATFRQAAPGGDIVGIVTARDFGAITRTSFSVHREYENRDGQPAKSPWFDTRHLTIYRDILAKCEQKAAEVESAMTQRANRTATPAPAPAPSAT